MHTVKFSEYFSNLLSRRKFARFPADNIFVERIIYSRETGRILNFHRIVFFSIEKKKKNCERHEFLYKFEK